MRLAYSFVLSLSCLVASVPVSGQQPSTPGAREMALADSAFASNAWQAAADAYHAALQVSPTNGMGWFRYGSSLEQLGKADEAMAAYDHAMQLGFQPLMTEFRVARVLSRKGNTTEALSHLRKLASLGLPPAMLDSEPAFTALRSSADFAAIRKTAEDTRFPCRAVHTFDFWAGTFDAAPWTSPNGPWTGELHNSREYDGCVILERWMGSGNRSAGMSMAFYDVNRHVWRMVWNDDSNSSNDFEGSYHDGAMRFMGWVLDAKGNKILASNVLQDVSPDTIRHIYSTSADGGKTWQVRSDGRFVRRKP